MCYVLNKRDEMISKKLYSKLTEEGKAQIDALEIATNNGEVGGMDAIRLATRIVIKHTKPQDN